MPLRDEEQMQELLCSTKGTIIAAHLAKPHCSKENQDLASWCLELGQILSGCSTRKSMDTADFLRLLHTNNHHSRHPPDTSTG